MKTRNSFVSNSSSSSFVIAYKPEDFENLQPCPHCGYSAPNFFDEVENTKDRDTYLAEPTSYLEWENNENLTASVRIYQEDGYTVQALELSYHDRFLNELFTKLINNGKLILVSGECS